MSDLLIKISEASLIGLIPLGFSAGFLGSLHCVGMCGAFSASCQSKKSYALSYHSGKALSYTLLGALSAMVGASLTFLVQNPYFKAIPAIFLGLTFIWIGFKSWSNNAEINQVGLPEKVLKWNQKWLGKSYQLKKGVLRSFSIGFFSALLPCGLLYGVLFSFAALQSPLHGAVGMLSFSLGTAPALILGPGIILKLFSPLKKSWPRLSQVGLISLGIFTISYRMVMAYGQASCH